MFTIESVVTTIVYLLVAGIIFGLLLWLINYVSAQFPTLAPFAGIARVVLVIFAVLVLIGFLLSLVGHPVLRMSQLTPVNWLQEIPSSHQAQMEINQWQTAA